MAQRTDQLRSTTFKDSTTTGRSQIVVAGSLIENSSRIKDIFRKRKLKGMESKNPLIVS